MKFCTECGANVVDGMCPKCGARAARPTTAAGGSAKDQLMAQKDKLVGALPDILTGGGKSVGGSSSQWNAEAAPPIGPDSNFKNYFMNPKEKMVCILGNSYLQNFLTDQSFSKGFSVVSDKRVYFRGVVFSAIGKKFHKTKVSSAVNIRDVTGVKVAYFSPIHHIIAGILSLLAGMILFSFSGWLLLLGLIVAAGNFAMFALKRVTLLTIEYAGGAIGFDVKWFSEEESVVYQKSLFLAKDKIFKDAD